MIQRRLFHFPVLVLLVAAPLAASRAQKSNEPASLEGSERAGDLAGTSTMVKVLLRAGTEPTAVHVRRSGDLAIFQGDIVLGRYSELAGDTSKDNAIKGPPRLWQDRDPANSKNVMIPYVFDSMLPARERAAVKAAIAHFSAKTCIRFIPRTNQPNHVKFIFGQGCYSYIGRLDGEQLVSIGNGCGSVGTAAHEMAHTLGMFHVQSRFDRNNSVLVNEENISPEARQDFDIVNDPATQDLPYDYGSIMHFSRFAFSANGKETLTPKKAGTAIGQRAGLSELDVQTINKLYQCQ